MSKYRVAKKRSSNMKEPRGYWNYIMIYPGDNLMGSFEKLMKDDRFFPKYRLGEISYIEYLIHVIDSDNRMIIFTGDNFMFTELEFVSAGGILELPDATRMYTDFVSILKEILPDDTIVYTKTRTDL